MQTTLWKGGSDWIDGSEPERKPGNSKQNYYASDAGFQQIDGVEEYTAYRAYFVDQLEIDILIHDNPYDRETFEGILDILVETCTSKKPVIRVSNQDLPTAVVKSKLMKLNIEHIRYVMNCMQQNTSRIRNIRQYLLTALFNAPSTINQFYQALVNSDIQNGLV